MKATCFILKVAAVILALGAVACCILANLEKITDYFLSMREKCTAKRAACAECGDMDEYEDWDI